jgi:hypothetical protein
MVQQYWRNFSEEHEDPQQQRSLANWNLSQLESQKVEMLQILVAEFSNAPLKEGSD